MKCFVVTSHYRDECGDTTSWVERTFATREDATAWVEKQKQLNTDMENIVQSYRGMDEDEAFSRFEKEKDLLPIKVEYFDDMMEYIVPLYDISEVPFGPEGNDESHS